eukprot:gene11338-19753_t
MQLEEAAGLKGVAVERWQTFSSLDPWSSDSNVDFQLSLVEPCKKSMLALKKLSVANKTLERLGDFDVELWTDGSAEGGVRKGGAGVIVRDLRRQISYPPISVAAGEVVSSYRAEEVGIRRALQELAVRGMPDGTRVLLCCDSLSAVQRLSQGPDAQEDRVAHDIWRLIAQLFPKAGGSRLVIQWCPSHCGLVHNCEADDAAKMGKKAGGAKRARVEFGDIRLLQSIVKQHGGGGDTTKGAKSGRRRRGARAPRLPSDLQEQMPKETGGDGKSAGGVVCKTEKEPLNSLEVYQIVLVTLRSIRTARVEKRRLAPAQGVLRQRVEVAKLKIKEVRGDGNCLFRVISRQLQFQGMNATHQEIREAC